MKLPKISVNFVVAQPLALITFWISLCEHYLWIIYGPSIWWCTSRHHMEYILTWWRRFVNKWWPTCMIRHLMNQGHFLKINLITLSRFLINSVVEVGTHKIKEKHLWSILKQREKIRGISFLISFFEWATSVKKGRDGLNLWLWHQKGIWRHHFLFIVFISIQLTCVASAGVHS